MQRLIPFGRIVFLCKKVQRPKKSSSIPSTNGTPSFHPTTRNPTHQGFQRCQPLTRSDTTTTPVEGRKLAHTHTVRSWGNRLILPGTRVRCDHGVVVKFNGNHGELGIHKTSTFSCRACGKNSLKFRGSSFHSIDESIESKSCFKICPMKMTQRSDPFFECSWLEQFITSSDFCGQFLDAQFFVALSSLQRSLQKSSGYFAGGWWWFCKKTCHKREWIPPEKNIRPRRFHYLNPLPSRTSSFVFALVFLDCLEQQQVVETWSGSFITE